MSSRRRRGGLGLLARARVEVLFAAPGVGLCFTPDKTRARRGYIQYKLSTGHRLRGPIRRHAARVAARDDGPAAANRVEIWIHRREYPPIESELTGVGISGRAAPLSAELSEWSSCLLVNFQACPKRRPRQQ